MKTKHKLTLAVAVGTAIGAVAIQGLHAQAKPPVYVITDIAEITDAEGYKVIGQRSAADAAANFKEFGGRYVVRTDRVTDLDGIGPKRLIIAAFDSAEKAQAWANSKHQKEVTAIRVKNTKSRSFIVEGM
jgi:uncharacterized protein (DUF1330 family)